MLFLVHTAFQCRLGVSLAASIQPNFHFIWTRYQVCCDILAKPDLNSICWDISHARLITFRHIWPALTHVRCGLFKRRRSSSLGVAFVSSLGKTTNALEMCWQLMFCCLCSGFFFCSCWFFVLFFIVFFFIKIVVLMSNCFPVTQVVNMGISPALPWLLHDVGTA